MPLNPQTSNFPAIAQPDRGWDKNLSAVMDITIPLAVSRTFRVDIPVNTSGAPIAGLTPIFNSGYMVKGDNVLQLNPDVAPTAPASSTRNLYYGLSGAYYDTAARKANDVQLATIITNADRIVAVSQLVGYGGYRYAVRSLLNLEFLTDGSDQLLYTMSPPLGFNEIRIPYAMSRVNSATTAGNTTGDDLIIKGKFGAAATFTLTTLTAANLGSAGTVAQATMDDADTTLRAWAPGNFQVHYNQTDTSTTIAGGLVESLVVVECF